MDNMLSPYALDLILVFDEGEDLTQAMEEDDVMIYNIHHHGYI